MKRTVTVNIETGSAWARMQVGLKFFGAALAVLFTGRCTLRATGKPALPKGEHG